MIYQHVNKRAKILPLATFHIAHLCKQFNQFKQLIALPISMPRFKSIIFHQYSPKIKLFFKQMQNFQALGAPPPNPRASGSWGLCPQTPNSLQRLGAEGLGAPSIANFWLPKTAPSIANFWLRAYHALPPVYNHMGFRRLLF